MTKDQIIDLWISVGWNNINNYHNHLKSGHDKIILSHLDPDKINPKVFWQASDEHFGTDPVCNQTAYDFSHSLDIKEANHFNNLVTIHTGMAGQTMFLASLLNAKFGRVDIAEIGCGYGAGKSLYLEIENKYYGNTTYTGFDIIKRMNSSLEPEGEDGTFSNEQISKYAEEFNLFFSSNTFQHLSRKQIESYLRGIYNMLPYGGYFNMMYVDDCKETYHYGQVIELVPIPELITLIKVIGFDIVGSSTIEIPNSLKPINLVLRK